MRIVALQPIVVSCDAANLDFLLDAWTEAQPNRRARAGELYERYRAWADDNGEAALSQRDFTRAIKVRGFRHRKMGAGAFYLGLGLLPKDFAATDDGE